MRFVMYFGHEKLDCFRLTVKVGHWLKASEFPRGDANLKEQALRAIRSVGLNIAEGCGRGEGKASKNHFNIARGSAAEVSAVLDFVHLNGAGEQQDRLRRINAMLFRMSR